MAIGRVPGAALEASLDRQGIDLSFVTTGNSLVKLDFTNFRMGINKESPDHALDIVGNVQISNDKYLFVDRIQANSITTTSATIDMQGKPISNVASPTASDQVATKGYVDLALIQDSKLEQGTSNIAVVDTGAIQEIQFNIGNVRVANINATTTEINDLVFGNTTITSGVTNANILINPPGTGILQILGTDAMLLPVGNTSQRPTAITGMIRFNGETNGLEYYDGSSWKDPLNATLATMTSQIINANGAVNTYTLSANATTQGVLVSINGTLQQPVTSYTVSGNQISFTETPQADDVIEVRQIAFGVGYVGGLNSGSTTISIPSTNGALDFIMGGVPALSIGTVELHTQPGGLISNIGEIIADVPSVAQLVDYFDATKYRSAKYVLQATNENEDIDTYEVLVNHSGNVAYQTTYAVLRTSANIVGNISATYDTGNAEVQVYFTSTYANVSLRQSNKILLKI